MEAKFSDLRDYFNSHSLLQQKQSYSDSKRSRAGLVQFNRLVKNYGHVKQYIYEAYSSGEESDIEDEKINEATVRDVNFSTLFDRYTIMIAVAFNC